MIIFESIFLPEGSVSTPHPTATATATTPPLPALNLEGTLGLTSLRS